MSLPSVVPWPPWSGLEPGTASVPLSPFCGIWESGDELEHYERTMGGHDREHVAGEEIPQSISRR